MNSVFPKKTVHIITARGTIDVYKLAYLKTHLDLIRQVVGGNITYNPIAREIRKEVLCEMRKHLIHVSHGRRGDNG